MRRSLVLSVVAIGLGALSCQLGIRTPVESPAATVADLETAAQQADPFVPPAAHVEQIEILRCLRARHSVLSDAELLALAYTIVAEAERHDLDPMLVTAVIQVESGGHHLAVSPVGALGLMQLLPSTAEEVAGKLGIPWHGPASLFDPFLNVKLGTAYLRELADRYDDVGTALAAYNWGPGHIDRRLRRGVAMPVRYVRLVMKAWDAREEATQATRS